MQSKIIRWALVLALTAGCGSGAGDAVTEDSGKTADTRSGEVSVDVLTRADLLAVETVDLTVQDAVPGDDVTEGEELVPDPADVQEMDTAYPPDVETTEVTPECTPGEPCDDQELCTDDDTCNDEGLCVGDKVVCSDDNPCTMGWCDAEVGCKYDEVIAACTDGDPCTKADFCDEGVCMPGPDALECDDENPCTDDICVPFEGCDVEFNNAPCEDGEQCTDNDTCKDGVCQAGDLVCGCQNDLDCEQYEDGDFCNGILYCNTDLFPPACVVDIATVVSCVEQAPMVCNEWQCDPPTGDCLPVPLANGEVCNDEHQCTIEDQCQDGICVGNMVPNCGVGESCHTFLDCLDGLTCFDGMPGGYCTKLDCQTFGCPVGTVCNSINNGQMTVCQKECAENNDCRVDEGHGCTEYGGCWCGEEWCTAGDGSCLGEVAGVCNSCGSALENPVQDCTELDLVCQAGECVPCDPDCEGKVCGPDGCDGSCGDCEQYHKCDGTGQCVCDCPPLDDPYCDTATGMTYQNECMALCYGVEGAEQGACPDCQDFCTADQLQSQELCGKDGVTYPNFCELKCTIGGPDCLVVESCHDMAHPGACLDACWVSDPTEIEEGSPLGEFACKDLNDTSSWFGLMLTEVSMKELIWIAYLGSCT
jgi:hypothetical protein